jgi:hypothetical protein
MEICGKYVQRFFSTREFDEYTEELEKQYRIIGFIDGHVYGGKIRNPIWVISDTQKIDVFLLMLCNSQYITKLCIHGYKKIIDFERDNNENKKITWYKTAGGYICGTGGGMKTLGIHQVIMMYYRHGRGTGELSVDHIDRDPFNNTLDNLRLATCEEQNKNMKGVLPGTKKERQHQARELPEGIQQEDMPKYVTYNVNVWNKPQNKKRDFFRIERHPLMSKIWEGTKSMKISIHKKLEQAKKVLHDIENGILPIANKTNDRILPTHVYFTMIRNCPTLVYDNRTIGHTKRMKIKDTSFDINDLEKRKKQLLLLNHILIKTFGNSILSEDENKIKEETTNEIDSFELELPKYVSIRNEDGNTILIFHRILGKQVYNKRMKLPNYYESISCIGKKTNEKSLLDDIDTVLPQLNSEIIQKYGKEYSILDISDEIVEEIKEEKEERKINGFPMYARIQKFSNGDYLVFNKCVNKTRLYTNMKLPHNYCKNNQLHILNAKIIELYGDGHALDLTYYPREETPTVVVPENMYLVLQSKNPYLFVIKENNKVITHQLPNQYHLQDEIQHFADRLSCISPNKTMMSSFYRETDDWKPKNISLIMKDGKPTLFYQKRVDNCKHGISILLPSTPFHIELYLVEMNRRIIAKYGREHSIF